MRDNKPFTVVTYTKDKEPEQFVHCAIHRSNRMVKLADGSLRCTACGGIEIATRTAFTFMNKPISPTAQEVGQKDAN